MKYFVILLVPLLLLCASAHADDLELGIAAYRCQEYDKAVKLLLPVAEQENAEAQYYLGRAIEGTVMRDDVLLGGDRLFKTQEAHLAWEASVKPRIEHSRQAHIEANRWFRKSAENGYARAQVVVGDSYGSQNPEAAKWWLLAAAQGNAQARDRLSSWAPEKMDRKTEIAEMTILVLAIIFLPVIAKNKVDWQNRMHVIAFAAVVLLVLSPWVYRWSMRELGTSQEMDDRTCSSQSGRQ